MSKFFYWLLSAGAMSIALTSCHPDKKVEVKPEKPEVPQEKVEIPEKIQLDMRGGHLHGATFHANPSFLNVEFPLKNKWTVVWNKSADGKSYQPQGDALLRLKSHTIWASEIVFSDKEGKRMNAPFAEGEGQDLFQFFITADNIRQYTPGEKTAGAPLQKSLEEIMSGFIYRDTNPEDHMYGRHGGGGNHQHNASNPLRHEEGEVKLSGRNVGFKGYFHNPESEKEKFIGIRENHVAFDMTYRLVRFASLDAKKKGGNYRSVFAWEEPFGALTVLSFTAPVRIVTQHPGEEDGFTEMIQDIANEFGLSKEKVEELYDESWSIPLEGEGSEQYHM